MTVAQASDVDPSAEEPKLLMNMQCDVIKSDHTAYEYAL